MSTHQLAFWTSLLVTPSGAADAAETAVHWPADPSAGARTLLTSSGELHACEIASPTSASEPATDARARGTRGWPPAWML